jgi:CBS domain-containing protein
MKVRDVMSSPVVIAPADATLGEVGRRMLEYNIGAVPLVDARGRFAGMVTELDFCPADHPIPFSAARRSMLFHEWMSDGHPERAYAAAAATAVGEVARGRDVTTLAEDDPLERVIELFLDHHVHAIPVLHGDVPVGIVTRHDLIRVMLPDAEAGARPSRETPGAPGFALAGL